ncbi:MAG: NAD(P)/FAD-dependent oxidoreductase [bacterium]
MKSKRGNRPPKVVIVGAGFGGLSAATRLKRVRAEITIVDRQNHHLFQPLLYQVATAAISPAEIAWPIRRILRRQKNVTVLMAEVQGIDRESRTVDLGYRNLPYDYLILAPGSRHSYFGHDEFEPYAPGLKEVDDATALRRRLLLAFELAESVEDAEFRRACLTFVIVGAGPTGVELAGTIAELARLGLSQDFRRIDSADARIVLVDGADRVLPTYDPELSGYTEQVLRRLGVEVRLGRMATNVTADSVTLDNNEIIPTQTVVWAAGNEASPLVKDTGVETNKAGQALVTPRLTIPGAPEIFIIGDAAYLEDEKGEPLPGIAPVAKQQGRYAADIIRSRINGRRKDGKPFHYRDYGLLATIGRNSAIADFGRFKLKGSLAWWFWGLAHIYYLIGLPSKLLILIRWFYYYLTYDRGARLITGLRNRRRPLVRHGGTVGGGSEDEAA